MSAPFNPSAFPSPGVMIHSMGTQQGAYEGMSLRDYFAAAVLATLGYQGSVSKPYEVALYCYGVADAMLERRSET